MHLQMHGSLELTVTASVPLQMASLCSCFEDEIIEWVWVDDDAGLEGVRHEDKRDWRWKEQHVLFVMNWRRYAFELDKTKQKVECEMFIFLVGSKFQAIHQRCTWCWGRVELNASWWKWPAMMGKGQKERGNIKQLAFFFKKARTCVQYKV